MQRLLMSLCTTYLLRSPQARLSLDRCIGKPFYLLFSDSEISDDGDLPNYKRNNTRTRRNLSQLQTQNTGQNDKSLKKTLSNVQSKVNQGIVLDLKIELF